METRERLLSLDALRGFDMFFITGGSALAIALCKAFGWGDGWLARQMTHVPWQGLAHHDTIFPLFLFLAGVSWPFSYAAQLAKGRTTGEVIRKVIARTAVLFLFGLSCGGVLRFAPQFRIPSVLGHIGLSWGIAALLFLCVNRSMMRVGIIAFLLFAYWMLFNFVHVSGCPEGAGAYSQTANIISWLDRTVMPNHILVPQVYDPESLFSVPNGVALALIGMCAGSVLRCERLPKARRAGVLIVWASGLLIADGVFLFVMNDQIVKALWTSSFVLSTAVYSMLLLALFYWLVDVKGWRRWTFYFRVIGLNSITIYMAQMVGIVRPCHDYLFGGLVDFVGAPWNAVVGGLTYCSVVWLFLYWLYRRNIFLKV